MILYSVIEGETKIKKKFAWFPITITEELETRNKPITVIKKTRIWLQFYYIKYGAMADWFDRSMYWKVEKISLKPLE